MFFFILCTAEAATLLALLCLYRAPSKVDTFSFLLSLPGVLFLCSSIILTLSISWVIRTFRISGLPVRKRLAMACALNILILVLTVGSIEILVRIFSTHTAAGETIRGVLLRPRKWSDVVALYKPMLEQMTHDNPFTIYDPILGWTNAPSRQNATGQYASSAEGLRAPRIGMSFADRRTRHSGLPEKPVTVRVALMGDSMTFGTEVRCEDSWGHALEAQLGTTVQVLNFGVSGHGLNQVLLRYERDARPWKPQIVLIGITSEEIRRIINVYIFTQNPTWMYPFVRPRLILKNGTPSPINQPLPTPAEVFAHTTIRDLPHLDQDAYFRPLEWERDGLWNFFEQSYFFRLLISLRPPTNLLQERISEKTMMALGQQVLTTLVRDVREQGAIPLVVHFPYQWELRKAADYGDKYIPLSVQMLRAAGIDHYDMTTCLIEAKAFDEYMPQSHYSPRANAVIAKCLQPIVREEMGRLKQ
jgi:lysophospholipase L1-like esterase